MIVLTNKSEAEVPRTFIPNKFAQAFPNLFQRTWILSNFARNEPLFKRVIVQECSDELSTWRIVEGDTDISEQLKCGVGVWVGVLVNFAVAVGVRVGVTAIVCVGVDECSGVTVFVAVMVGVCVIVPVEVTVKVGVTVAVIVAVDVTVLVAVFVTVRVGANVAV